MKLCRNTYRNVEAGYPDQMNALTHSLCIIFLYESNLSNSQTIYIF